MTKFTDDEKKSIRERINSAQENLEDNFSGGLVH
jgi:hypothetical protein